MFPSEIWKISYLKSCKYLGLNKYNLITSYILDISIYYPTDSNLTFEISFVKKR